MNNTTSTTEKDKKLIKKDKVKWSFKGTWEEFKEYTNRSFKNKNL